MAYTDPCEVLTEEDDSSSGSAVPPTTPDLGEGLSEDPIFPEGSVQLPNLYEENKIFTNTITIIDSSNYYPSRYYPDLRIGIRTPGELQVPPLGSLDVLSENTGNVIPFKTERLKETVDLIKKENRIRNTDDNMLDVPFRDNFRHMLKSVWESDMTAGSAFAAKKNKVEFTTEINVRPSGARHEYRVYDYSRETEIISTRFDQTRMGQQVFGRDIEFSRNPYLLYIWNDIVAPNQNQESILGKYITHLGLRFDTIGMAKAMKQDRITNPTNFWDYENLTEMASITDLALRLEEQFAVKPNKAREICDLWVMGTTDSRDLNSNKVNPGTNFLIRNKISESSQEPDLYFEDYAFQTPGAIDYDQLNPSSVNGDANEGIPQVTDVVRMQTFSSTFGDFMYNNDRNRLKNLIRSGQLNVETIVQEPLQVPVAERINFYEFANSIADQNAGGAGTPIKNSPVQIYTGQDVLEINELSENILDPQYNPVAKNHVRITFDASHDSRIAEILQTHGFDHMALEIFHNNENTSETFTQFVDSSLRGVFAGGQASLNQFVRYNLSMDQVENLTTPKKVKDFFYLMESQRELYEEAEYREQSRLLYPFGHPRDKFPRAPEIFSTQLDIVRDEIKQHLSGRLKQKRYEDILDGRYSYSEVIAYKIVKTNTDTGEDIQTFYIFNPSLNNLAARSKVDFVDTQVLPGENYEYSVFTVNAVVGMEYIYRNFGALYDANRSPLFFDPEYEPNGPIGPMAYRDAELNQFPYYRINVETTNHLALIEAPYFQKTISIGNTPPSSPEIIFLPEVGTDDKFTILFKPQVGSEYYSEPIEVLSTDRVIIDKMLSEASYSDPENVRRIRYQSYSDPLVYELIMLSTPPSRYSDFSEGRVFKTDFSTPYINFKIDINKSYYVIARSHDRSGISNPTEILKIRMESHEDGINPIFEPYELRASLSPSEINFQNIISIQPSRKQKLIDFSQMQTENPEDFYQSAPNLESLNLVRGEENIVRIWGKKYKFRLKSKSSGKAIDINVSFRQERREETNETYASQQFLEVGTLTVPDVTYQDVSTDQRYRYTSSDSGFAEVDTGLPQVQTPDDMSTEFTEEGPEGVSFDDSSNFENLNEMLGEIVQADLTQLEFGDYETIAGNNPFNEIADLPGVVVGVEVQVNPGDITTGATDPFVTVLEDVVTQYDSANSATTDVLIDSVLPDTNSLGENTVGASSVPASAYALGQNTGGTGILILGDDGVFQDLGEVAQNSVERLLSSETNTSSVLTNQGNNESESMFTSTGNTQNMFTAGAAQTPGGAPPSNTGMRRPPGVPRGGYFN